MLSRANAIHPVFIYLKCLMACKKISSGEVNKYFNESLVIRKERGC